MNDAVYILDEELLASNGKRFLNYLIDYIFTYVFAYLFGMCLPVLVSVFDSFGLTGFGFWFYNIGDFVWFLVGIILTLFYYIVTENFFGQSLGKLLTGTIVVDENGLRPSFGTIFKRTLCRLIPFDGLSFFGSRGWHDSITDTYVVNKKALAESIKMFHDFKLIGVQEVEA